MTNVSKNLYSIVLLLMVIIRTLYYRAKKINTYGQRSKMKYLVLDRSSSIQGYSLYDTLCEIVKMSLTINLNFVYSLDKNILMKQQN